MITTKFKPSRLDLVIVVVALFIAAYDFSVRLFVDDVNSSNGSSPLLANTSNGKPQSNLNADEVLAYYLSYGDKGDNSDQATEVTKEPELSEQELIEKNDPWKDSGIMLGNFRYRLTGVFIDQLRTAVLQSYSYEDGQRRVKAVKQGDSMGQIVISRIEPKFIELTLTTNSETTTKRIYLFPQRGTDG